MVPMLRTKNRAGKWMMCDYLKSTPAEIDTNTLSLCSGIRDNNDVMIWEGDIASVQNTYCDPDAPKHYYVVRWREDAAALVYTDNEQCYYNNLNGFNEHCIIRVEGNVWDNPELLELIPTAEEHTAELNEAFNNALAKMSERPSTLDELNKKYPEPREGMSEERERAYVADLFNCYETEGFSRAFWTKETDLSKHNGEPFAVLGRVSEFPANEDGADLDVLPMWNIRFPDGQETAAYPDEIIPSQIRDAGCPEEYL